MTRKAVVIVLPLVLMAFAIWYLLSPARTVADMQEAMKVGDEAVIASLVDFPAVREDAAKMMISMGDQDPDFRRMVAAHPAKRAEFMEAAKRQMERELTPQSIALLLREAEANGPAPGMPRLSEGWEISSSGWNRFSVVHPDPDGKIQLNFERRGFKWRIVGFELGQENDYAQVRSDLEKTFTDEHVLPARKD